MKFKILLSLFLINITFLNAQNSTPSGNGTISGKVIDKNSKQPISYVNISVKKADKIITGGITDDNGNFVVKNIPLDTYTVELLFIGYKKQTFPITLNSTDKIINLNTIALVDEAIQLEGVEIVKEKSTYEQKIDRKIINVGKDLISLEQQLERF